VTTVPDAVALVVTDEVALPPVREAMALTVTDEVALPPKLSAKTIPPPPHHAL